MRVALAPKFCLHLERAWVGLYISECVSCATRLCVHPEFSRRDMYTAECVICGARTFPVHPTAVVEGIGPRRVGGVYRSYDTGSVDTVVAIETAAFDMPWAITVRGEDGVLRRHCTAWDQRNEILRQPPEATTVTTAYGRP
ncbi:hypothetical protein [Nocardia asiatica]|uniref:hypothetical protein n=1 Tax=Nocardia asiatica TaxID=209252 RepID=UPI0002FB2819|nr:hypothetical protein [Nocardia asiatica]